jgi:1,2-diacylglycerol 3-beta-glucosyltransferase
VSTPLRAVQALLGATTLHGLALLVAAATNRRGAPSEMGTPPRLLVVVPAHDEEAVIGDLLESLRQADYPADRLDVVVVADNCSDRTAELARAAGAEVLERRDEKRRGKGHALAWGLERLRGRAEAVVLIDADCTVSPGALRALTSRLCSGAAAVQADYRVANPKEAPAAALRYAGFVLVNTVRPLGKSRLGLSCGLTGTGMGFDARLLERLPWAASSLAEDAEQHLRIVAAGGRAEFAPDALVTSPMPTSLAGSDQQQARWEKGRLELARRWTPRLLRDGLRRRDPVRVHAALEQLVPPQSIAVAGSVASGLAAAVLGDRRGVRGAALLLAGQGVFVVGGLALARAPWLTYRALTLGPALLADKLCLYGRIAAGRGPSTWERTRRESASPEDRTPAHVQIKSVGKA